MSVGQKNIGALDEDDAPYISAPYPRNIVQVQEPDTRGERDVVKLINEHWFEKIDDLEEISNDMFEGDGYSGSFIRSVLREHFAPVEDVEDDVAQEDETEEINEEASEEGEGEEDEEDQEAEENVSRTRETDQIAQMARDQMPDEPEEADSEVQPQGYDRRRVFREGVKTMLMSDMTKDDALAFFEEGLEEGEILLEEIDL